MYIKLCFMYFNCVLVVEIFYCLFLGLCCLWRFSFFFTLKTSKQKKRKMNLTSWYNVDTEVKRKEADSCKYCCTHTVAERYPLRFLFFFINTIRALLVSFHNNHKSILCSTSAFFSFPLFFCFFLESILL